LKELKLNRCDSYLEKPGVLTTSGRSKCNYPGCFNNKRLIPAMDGQLAPAWIDQGLWLFQYVRKTVKLLGMPDLHYPLQILVDQDLI
jgi:hypothetical protein